MLEFSVDLLPQLSFVLWPSLGAHYLAIILQENYITSWAPNNFFITCIMQSFISFLLRATLCYRLGLEQFFVPTHFSSE